MPRNLGAYPCRAIPDCMASALLLEAFDTYRLGTPLRVALTRLPII